MTPFIWRDRLVKLEDGNFVMSARGDHDDFDFQRPDADGAVAGNPGSKVLDIQLLDENRLRICAIGGYFILEGDDFNVTARIYREESPMKQLSMSAHDSHELLADLRKVVVEWLSCPTCLDGISTGERRQGTERVLFMKAALTLATAAVHMARSANGGNPLSDEATKDRLLAFLRDVSGCDVVRVEEN